MCPVYVSTHHGGQKCGIDICASEQEYQRYLYLLVKETKETPELISLETVVEETTGQKCTLYKTGRNHYSGYFKPPITSPTL